MRSTKIVATLGPASNDTDVLEQMIAAGLDVARLNFAHGDAEEHAGRVDRLRAAAERVGREVAVLCDIPGPKLRIGPVAGGHTELHNGSRVVLTTEAMDGTAERLPVEWKGLPELVKPGDVAYLADGAIRLRVVDVGDSEVVTEVEVGGFLASRQGINLPNVTTSLPAVSEDDLALLDAGAAMGVDVVALSFVRRREDLEPVRNHMTAKGYDLPLIAKIEKPQAAANAEEIIDAADGVMVARGDLGIELPIEEVPLVQKRILYAAGQRAKPSITATQMLMSMVSSTRPTRAEVTDVANAIFDGTDAVMLSQETAVGEYPVLAVEMMASIATTTERELPYDRWLIERGLQSSDEASAIAYGAVGAVSGLGLSALIVPTYTGTTARLMSSHRPRVPVLAICPDERIARRCELYWGVKTTIHPEPEDTTELIAMCARAAIGAGVASRGDRVGITAGLPAGRSGGTNLFKVHTI
jgi:pyruvate kinase